MNRVMSEMNLAQLDEQGKCVGVHGGDSAKRDTVRAS